MIHIYIFIFLLILIYIISFGFIFRKIIFKQYNNLSEFDISWNINKNFIEGFEPNKLNSFTSMEVPTDFSTVENPSWKIS